MTTIDQHREALRASGLTDEQIDNALNVMDAAAASSYVDPHDRPANPHAVPMEAPKWTCETPPSAFLLSLNGFDEIAIAANFGARIHDLREDPITGGRALVFVHQRRIGLKDPDAYNACMALSMQEVMDYFHPEPKPGDASAEGNAQGAYL